MKNQVHPDPSLVREARELIAKWRRVLVRYATHGDSYQIGQGRGLGDCANDLEALLESAAHGRTPAIPLELPCLLDADLSAKCVTHDTPCDWVECTGWRCPESGHIVTEQEADRPIGQEAPAIPPEGWQPIETAPKDGTRIVGFSAARVEPIVVVAWGRSGWWTKPGAYQVATLTHWQPLPAPPLSGCLPTVGDEKRTEEKT